jgi:hypothetical protein
VGDGEERERGNLRKRRVREGGSVNREDGKGTEHIRRGGVVVIGEREQNK